MRKTVKWFVFPVLLLLLLLPQTVWAASASAASLITYTFDKQAVTLGESATMTIRTNAATNYVWVKCDGTLRSAAYVTTNVGGLKEWNITLSPSKTQAVFVYANTANSTTGAVVRVRSIKVDAVSVKIESLSIDKAVLTEGETATINIKTNDKVGYVWAFYDNQYYPAEFKSNGAANTKNWSLLVKPKVTQTITVYANTSYVTKGMVSANQPVTINKAVVTINSVSADETDIAKGESIEIAIRTNTEANFVWVECDGRFKNAKLENTRTGGKTWYVTVTPSEDQKIIVYAGWDNSETTAVTKTLQVYVSEDYVRILSIEPSALNVNVGETKALTVYTNYAASYVWTTINGNTVNFVNSYSNSRYDEKEWTCTTGPLTKNETITIYAGRYNYTSRNDTSATLRITMTGEPPSLIMSTNYMNVMANGSATFNVITNLAVDNRVEVRGLSASQYAVTRSTASNNQYVWTITIHSLTGKPGDTLPTFYIDAYANGYSVPATGSLSVTLY